MKRFIVFILTFFAIGILSSCSSIHYQTTKYTIQGYQVYLYDHRFSDKVCDRISQFGLFVRDGEDDYVTKEDFGECINTLFIKDNSIYYNLSEAVQLDFFTIDDILGVEWDFDVYDTHDLLDYTAVDYFIFKTDVSEKYDDSDSIERVLDISESVYQKFIIGYRPETMNLLGYIEVFHDETLIVTLEVYEQGIYDPFTDGFQESNVSELQGLFQSVVN